MEPEGSLPYSQAPATRPIVYIEPKIKYWQNPSIKNCKKKLRYWRRTRMWKAAENVLNTQLQTEDSVG